MRALRWGWLLMSVMIARGAHAAPDCQAEDGVRSEAECVHDAMAPEVIDQLYRLALSGAPGKLDPRQPPQDFLYVAEEAGEAARRKGLKPLLELAKSGQLGAITLDEGVWLDLGDRESYLQAHRELELIDHIPAASKANTAKRGCCVV